MGDPDPLAPVRDALARQYHAALRMLREAVEACPDELWTDARWPNRCWQLAYHALFFVHLYLQPDEAAFEPWAEHQGGVQHPDGIGGPPDPDPVLPRLPEPYRREQVLRYLAFCDALVEPALAAMDLAGPTSGFPWYPIPKLEHQLVNLRHAQHHAAQLADRLRTVLDVGVPWAGTHPPR